jgi:GntR family transcriptional regulator, transcriptional repressor for pyruvate dehydrogenase complex
LKRLSLIDTIVDEIKGKVITGEYKTGDMLGSQDELARRLGVSRASLREALKRLEMMGLVESRQGLGTFLKKIEPIDFMNPLSSFVVIDKKSAFELLEARLHIEGSLAALAASHATEEDLLALEDILSTMRSLSAAQEIEEFVKQDVQFHYAIAKASNNNLLVKIVEILRDLLRQLISKVFQNYPGNLLETIDQTNEFHQHIFDAIRSHKPEEARMHMEEHIRDVQKKVASSQRFNPPNEETNIENR